MEKISREKNYWIFQSNPEIFDLEEALKNLEKDTFTVNQFKDKIKDGDKILFWISGEEAGIIGYGEVITNPELIEPYEKALKFIKKNDYKREKLRVWVTYNSIVQKILKKDLEKELSDVFSELSIIKQPQGTNFRINQNIWDKIYENYIKNYFIFVFNEKYYEDQKSLGRIFKFPKSEKGSYKYKGCSIGSSGPIIDKVKIEDEVIWTISGKSRRQDRKCFWGYGKITDIDKEISIWKLDSTELKIKVKTDEIINKFPAEYHRLYLQSNDIINLGFFGTILINKFQYDFILREIKKYKIDQTDKEKKEKKVNNENKLGFLEFENIWKIINQLIYPGKLIYTVKKNKPNEIESINKNGIYVKTGKKPKLISKELIQKAWNNLVEDGVLYQGDHKKSTYRSSYMLALFSQLDFIDRNKKTPIHITINYNKIKQDNQKVEESEEEYKSFKEIELKLIDSLPFPLASILWQYKADYNLEHKVDRLLHFFEALSQFLSIILISPFYSHKTYFIKEFGIRKDKDLEWYKRPNFGNWNQIFSWLTKNLRRTKENPSTFKECRNIFGGASQSFFEKITDKLIFKTLEEVRQYRNNWKGHGGIYSEKDIKKRLKILEDCILKIGPTLYELFSLFSLISPINSEYIKAIYHYKVKIIMGTRTPFREEKIKTKSPMEKNQLYILHEQKMTPIRIQSLVRLMKSPKTEQTACYFFNRIENENARLVSYHFEAESEIYVPRIEILDIFKIFEIEKFPFKFSPNEAIKISEIFKAVKCPPNFKEIFDKIHQKIIELNDNIWLKIAKWSFNYYCPIKSSTRNQIFFVIKPQKKAIKLFYYEQVEFKHNHITSINGFMEIFPNIKKSYEFIKNKNYI